MSSKDMRVSPQPPGAHESLSYDLGPLSFVVMGGICRRGACWPTSVSNQQPSDVHGLGEISGAGRVELTWHAGPGDRWGDAVKT